MRNIPDPGFATDAGGVDPAVAAALVSYADSPAELQSKTLAVIQGTRLLVPVMALRGAALDGERGQAHRKPSDMATVLLRGRDGRLALLAFTSTDSLRVWSPEARPVPVTATQAAEAALRDDATAVVVDVAGPVKFVIEEDDLRSLADGCTLVGVNGAYGWVKAVDQE